MTGSDPMCVVCRSVYSRSSAEASLEPVVSQGETEEPSQPSDKVNIPSTSQEPSSSSAGTESISAISDSIIGGASTSIEISIWFSLSNLKYGEWLSQEDRRY